MPDSIDIAIVGAGIVGICAAAYLAEAGLSVTVFDRTGICEETSSGNAAAFAFSDVLPLSQKGMMRNLPRWLADPLGPLSIPPAYLPKLAPWLWRFWRSGAAAHYETALAAQGGLMTLAEAEWMALMDRSGTRTMLREDGSLELYESEAEFRASLPGWQAREAHGIEFRHMTAADMAALQPGLSPRFIKGTFTPGWFSIADPKDYVLALADRFRAQGGTILTAEVTRLEPHESGVYIRTNGKSLSADKVVIAAGAFSHRIAASLGERIPLETERGYNTTLPPGAFDLRCQMTFGGHGFVISRLSSGIRVGGAVELGGLSLPPNYKRSEAMLRKAKAFLPDLKTGGGTQWMGFRPSLPDSLPAIGRSKASPRVIHAFGHGHLGLTQSAGTARLVADLLTDQTPPVDLTPFSPQRF